MASDFNHVGPRRTANRLRAGDLFNAQSRPAGYASRFDQPAAGREADGASSAGHDAAASRDK